MVGVPLAGVLIAASSAPAVIVVDAASFFISGALILALVPRSSQPAAHPDEEGAGYLERLGQGMRYLRGDRLLMGIALMVLVTNLIDAASGSVLMPALGQGAPRQPGRHRSDLRRIRARRGVGQCRAFVARSAASPALGLRPRLPFRRGAAIRRHGAPLHCAADARGRLSRRLRGRFDQPDPRRGEYERVPRHLQARVLGAVGALAWAGIPVGGIVGGAVAQSIGLTGALLVAGAAYFITTLVPFVFPAWREMDRRPSAPAAASSQLLDELPSA